MAQNPSLLRPSAVISLAIGLLGGGGGAQAAQWTAEPSVHLRGEYNDNFRLRSTNPDSVWATVLDPRLQLGRHSALWDLTAGARVRAAWYTGEDGLDTVDNFLNLGTIRRFERGLIDFSASQKDDTTLQYETLDLDLGLTSTQVDRTTRSMRLAGQYQITEPTRVDVSVSYSTLDYDQGAQYGLLDYDYLTPALTLTHRLDAKTEIFGTLSRSIIEYDVATDYESETDSLKIGAAYEITERWAARAAVGQRRTTTSQLYQASPFSPIVRVEGETTGLVYDGSLTRQFETGVLSLTGAQTITPRSTGADYETTRISLEGTKRFSAKLSSDLAVSYIRATSVTGVPNQASRTERFRVAPSVAWRIDEDLILRAGYMFTRVERGLTTQSDADSNAIFASLGYTWPRMAVSR